MASASRLCWRPRRGISLSTTRYEKQIARYMKRYRKWQEQRNPPKPVAPPTLNEDGTSEWITGLNADLSGPKKAKEKKAPKEKAPKKTQKAE